MDSSPLNRLGGEIRNYIYELTLSESKPIHLRFTTQGPTSGEFHHTPKSPTEKNGRAMLWTCNQVREEAKEIAWSETSIIVHAGLDTGALAFEELVGWVGNDRLRLLQHTKIDIGIIKHESSFKARTGLRDVLETLWESTLATDEDTRLSLGFSVPRSTHRDSQQLDQLEVDFASSHALYKSIKACSSILKRRRSASSNYSSLEELEHLLADSEIRLQLLRFGISCGIEQPFDPPGQSGLAQQH